MRLGSVVARGAVFLVAAAAACSDDESPGITCGAGTVLEAGVCVPADAAGGEGGSSSGGKTGAGAGTPSVGNAGNANLAGTANQGGSDEVDSGGTHAGGTSGTDAGGEGGEGGSNEPGPQIVPMRWLVFTHEKGIFAYDVTKFPSPEALVPMSSKVQYAGYRNFIWSPDGRTLAYWDQGNVYAADMTGETPGAPRLLLSKPAPPAFDLYSLPQVAWSADNQSVAHTTQTALYVLDPAKAAPTLHIVTNTLKTYEWAPAGNALRYVDQTGTHVVRVTKGELGTPIAVDASASKWSPNGQQLAGVKGLDAALTTLQASSASLQLLTSLSEPVPDDGSGGEGGQDSGPDKPPVDEFYLRFNKDGSKLALSADLNGVFRGHIVTLKPTVSEPVAVTSNGPAGSASFCLDWSPDGTRLLCQWYKDPAAAWFAADADGGEAITVLDVGTYNTWTWSPNPARHQLFTSEYTAAPRLIMVDLAQPNTAVTLFTGTTPAYSVNPAGTLLAYLTKPTIRLVNLAAPATPPLDIQTDQFAYDPPVWHWSPNSKFIAVADGSHQLRLARIDGTSITTAVAVQSTSQYPIAASWQP